MNQENTSAPAENKMGTMPIGKLLFNMSLPMMISMLVQALYNIVDSIFVAKLSENALTAVSLAFPLQTLLIAVGTGTGVGMNALLSKSLGEKNFKKANATASNAAVLYFFSYLVFFILGFTIVRPFYASQIGNADQEIMTLGIEYLSTVMIFSFGLLAQVFFERLLTSTGRTIFSMTSQLTGAITNIILDPILIFGLLGAPKMGVTGAAVATVIGQCVAALVAGFCNHRYNHDVKLKFHGFRLDFHIIGTIYAVGIPTIIMQSIGSVMTYCMNRILIEFSSTATAVFGVYFKLQSFFFMPVFGLNNGITPIIAYNYGAGQRKRMLKTIKLSMLVAFCLTFIGFLCFEGIPQILLGMFNASDEMLTIGVPALRIIGIHYLIAWFCIVSGTVFQALGKAFFSMIVSIMRQLFVLIPAAYILAKLGGLHVVWWSFPIAEVISLMVSSFFLVRINRTIISRVPEGKL
ncbi:MATE family efflux transporter [Coprococcus comes]|uniref:Probable multidrug resistance protein NorM n=1 Tax=Coprococcus comes TaxID=410072 RepID=A0A3R6DYM1_9FIRM|nr:MATE family efflux transporter [Coprococcus comes]RGU47755.1 MATE family efflux transporter [Coprococcus comes]